MIADWTVDVGAESPSIDVPWEGWVDLRPGCGADRVGELVEVQGYPELRGLIEALHGAGLFTSKVDVFSVGREEVDPEIAEAGLEETAVGLGSYIDVLAGDLLAGGWERCSGFESFEQVGRVTAAGVGKMDGQSPCVAEVVVRPAWLFGEATFGWTVYAVGFGRTEAGARAAWAAAAEATIAAMLEAIRPGGPEESAVS